MVRECKRAAGGRRDRLGPLRRAVFVTKAVEPLANLVPRLVGQQTRVFAGRRRARLLDAEKPLEDRMHAVVVALAVTAFASLGCGLRGLLRRVLRGVLRSVLRQGGRLRL